MPYFFKRLLEVFVLSIICSASVIMLNISEIVTSRFFGFVFMALSAAAFLITNFVLMRAYIFGVDDRAAYCRVNGIILGLYSLASLTLILTRHGFILAWLFLPVKFIDAFGVSTMTSAIVFYALLVIEFFAVILEYNLEQKRRSSILLEKDD